MKPRHPCCTNCGATNNTVKLYWSERNMLKQKLKTNYCKKCARIEVPMTEPLKEKIIIQI